LQTRLFFKYLENSPEWGYLSITEQKLLILAVIVNGKIRQNWKYRRKKEAFSHFI